MLSSIHPLGERGKGNRFGVTAAAFVVGSVAGGGALGVATGALGLVASAWVTDNVAIAVVGLAALTGAAFERSGRSLPSIPRQVDENWLNEYRGWVYGLGYGFQLGAGVLTYVTTAAVFVTIVAAVLSGSPLAALTIGVTFGAARGLTLVPARSIRAPSDLVSFHRRLDRSAAMVRLASTSVLAITALGAGAVFLQELS